MSFSALRSKQTGCGTELLKRRAGSVCDASAGINSNLPVPMIELVATEREFVRALRAAHQHQEMIREKRVLPLAESNDIFLNLESLLEIHSFMLSTPELASSVTALVAVFDDAVLAALERLHSVYSAWLAGGGGGRCVLAPPFG